MIVQIYETQNFDEAEKLVEAGVEHVGVLVGKGEYPREFSPEQAKKILGGVTGQAKKVVLSLSRNINDIIEIVNKTNPDILHLAAVPEFFSPNDTQTLKKHFPELKIMRSIPVKDGKSMELAKQYDKVADYLLLDTQKEKIIGATGEAHDWDISKKIVESVTIPVILAGGIGPDNVAEAILRVKPFGVDSKTKTDKKGCHEKDIAKIKKLVRMAKTAERDLLLQKNIRNCC